MAKTGYLLLASLLFYASFGLPSLFVLLGIITVTALSANAVRNEKSEMGAYFRRMKSKSGHNQAVVATAHKMARILYAMVKYNREYNPAKVGCTEKELLIKKRDRAQKALQKLEQKLKEAS